MNLSELMTENKIVTTLRAVRYFMYDQMIEPQRIR